MSLIRDEIRKEVATSGLSNEECYGVVESINAGNNTADIRIYDGNSADSGPVQRVPLNYLNGQNGVIPSGIAQGTGVAIKFVGKHKTTPVVAGIVTQEVTVAAAGDTENLGNAPINLDFEHRGLDFSEKDDYYDGDAIEKLVQKALEG